MAHNTFVLLQLLEYDRQESGMNIYNALKKQKESVVVDLYLKDYDGANIYIALVYNEKIEKFKVLYVPIDAIRIGDKVEEYFCYQFIFVKTVNYIMELINENEDLYKEKYMLKGIHSGCLLLCVF